MVALVCDSSAHWYCIVQWYILNILQEWNWMSKYSIWKQFSQFLGNVISRYHLSQEIKQNYNKNGKKI